MRHALRRGVGYRRPCADPPVAATMSHARASFHATPPPSAAPVSAFDVKERHTDLPLPAWALRAYRSFAGVPLIVRDGVVALAFFALGARLSLGSEAFAPAGSRIWGMDTRPAILLVIALMTLPLALRRIQPGPAAAVSMAAALAAFFAPMPTALGVPMLATMAAVYSGIVYARPAVAGAVAVVAMGMAVAQATYDWFGNGVGVEGAAFDLLLVGFPVAAALGVRGARRGAQMSIENARAQVQIGEMAAKSAAVEERMRVSSEVHDIVGHHITGIVLQARAAAQRLDPSNTEARTAVDAVIDEGTQALAQLRQLLANLQPEGPAERGPQPGIHDIPALVDRATALGADVHLTVTGDPAGLPAGVGLALYRVAQEALTNVLRHSGPGPARVAVRHLPGVVELEVTNPRSRAAEASQAGHGLVSMRERVRVRGGDLEAGPTDDGWRVSARIPISSEKGATT